MLLDARRQDTIYALSSGAGRGGVAVFRLSGAQARSVACALCSVESFLPRHAHLLTLRNPQSKVIIDRGLVIDFPAPNSFTGEDSIEFHLHGSPAVEAALFFAFESFSGLRPAEAGEFTYRAFLNGRMDLVEAEGLADLIAADTEAERLLALRQTQGTISQTFSDWRQQLIEALALAEAGIDFADEESIGEATLSQAKLQIEGLLILLTKTLASPPLREKISRGLVVSLSGAPNAGKSSLLNALSGSERAIVTDQAGTTRDLIEIDLESAGLRLKLIDGAGLREAGDPVEAEGIRRAYATYDQADLVLWVVDPAQPDWPPLPLRDGLWVIINKIDRSITCSPPPALNGLPVFRLSAQSGHGLDKLRNALHARCRDISSQVNDGLLIHSRHQSHLQALLSSLESAMRAEEAEIFAEHLRDGARHIGRISGLVDVETILDSIFSRFCLGK